MQIAREHNIRFLETSAKANINIDKAFYDLAEAILNKMPAKADEQSGMNIRPSDNQPQQRSSCCGMS